MDGLSLFYNVWGYSWYGSDLGRLVWLTPSLLWVSAEVAGPGLEDPRQPHSQVWGLVLAVGWGPSIPLHINCLQFMGFYHAIT